MDPKLDELKQKVESTTTEEVVQVKTPLSETIKPIRKGINGWLVGGVSFVVLAGISIVPVQGANLLGSALNLVGLNQAAAGADLLANKGVGAALGAMQFDPTKPDQCIKLWDIVKTTKIKQTQNKNLNTGINLTYTPEGTRILGGTLGAELQNKSSEDIRVQASGVLAINLKDGLMYASNWAKDLNKTLDKPQDGKVIDDTLKQVQDTLNKTNWDVLNAKFELGAWQEDKDFFVNPKSAVLQLGKDLVELYEQKSIKIDGVNTDVNLNSTSLKLGSYENATLEDITTSATAGTVLQSLCSLVEKIDYGTYKSEVIADTGVSGRPITITFKSFSDVLDIVNTSAAITVETALSDEKLLKFAHEVTVANTPEGQSKVTYDEFVKSIKDGFRKEDARLDQDKDAFASLKKSIQWKPKLTVYVNKAFEVIGQDGMLDIGLTKDGIRELGKTAGFENGKPLNDAQVDLVCKLLCNGLSLSSSSLQTFTSLPDRSKSTITPEEWWKSVENNQGYKSLLKKWEDNFGKVTLPSMLNPATGTVEEGTPGGDASSTQLACNGGSYEFNLDGSIKCLTEQPIDTNINPAQ